MPGIVLFRMLALFTLPPDPSCSSTATPMSLAAGRSTKGAPTMRSGTPFPSTSPMNPMPVPSCPPERGRPAMPGVAPSRISTVPSGFTGMLE